eukprot:scaffold3641_cov32-Tisochrysis_lutea.AAC.3
MSARIETHTRSTEWRAFVSAATTALLDAGINKEAPLAPLTTECIARRSEPVLGVEAANDGNVSGTGGRSQATSQADCASAGACAERCSHVMLNARQQPRPGFPVEHSALSGTSKARCVDPRRPCAGHLRPLQRRARARSSRARRGWQAALEASQKLRRRTPCIHTQSRAGRIRQHPKQKGCSHVPLRALRSAQPAPRELWQPSRPPPRPRTQSLQTTDWRGEMLPHSP